MSIPGRLALDSAVAFSGLVFSHLAHFTTVQTNIGALPQKRSFRGTSSWPASSESIISYLEKPEAGFDLRNCTALQGRTPLQRNAIRSEPMLGPKLVQVWFWRGFRDSSTLLPCNPFKIIVTKGQGISDKDITV